MRLGRITVIKGISNHQLSQINITDKIISPNPVSFFARQYFFSGFR